jgi:ribose transport system permease protein
LNPPTTQQSVGSTNILLGVIHKPWLWSFIAAVLAFVATMYVSNGRGALSLLYTAMTFASFAAIVGIGQMLVITLGPGNVDLSIPASMTLSATLALKVMSTESSMILIGIAIALLVGVACGVFNFALILLLRIPPIIATLSSSFIFQSLAIWSNRGLRIKPPELMSQFVSGDVLGIPNVALVGILIAFIAWFLLERAIAGRWILAIGQNMRAAQLSGVPINSVRFGVYVSCAVLAAVAGFLLANFSGGAALNMGTEYMLMSIAVVVIGGSSIAGGKSNVPGIWGAALFMFLLVAMLNSFGLGAGVRLMMTGIIIVAVVSFASTSGEKR